MGRNERKLLRLSAMPRWAWVEQAEIKRRASIARQVGMDLISVLSFMMPQRMCRACKLLDE